MSVMSEQIWFIRVRNCAHAADDLRSFTKTTGNRQDFPWYVYHCSLQAEYANMRLFSNISIATSPSLVLSARCLFCSYSSRQIISWKQNYIILSSFGSFNLGYPYHPPSGPLGQQPPVRLSRAGGKCPMHKNTCLDCELCSSLSSTIHQLVNDVVQSRRMSIRLYRPKCGHCHFYTGFATF